MKYTILVTAVLFLFSCTGNKPAEQAKEKPIAPIAAKEPRKLRYIMKPHHCGIIGFFNDGSVAGSIDPAISKQNIATLDTAAVYAHYSIDKNYIIFNDDHSSLDFSSDIKDAYSWVMVDYKWKVLPK